MHNKFDTNEQHIRSYHKIITIPLIPFMVSGYDQCHYCDDIVKSKETIDDLNTNPGVYLELFKFRTNVDQFDDSDEHIKEASLEISIPKEGFDDGNGHEASFNITQHVMEDKVSAMEMEYSVYKEGRDIIFVADIHGVTIE